MRLLCAVFLSGIVFTLCSCETASDESRRTHEAGGTIPWNRPATWEGGGALGSQINEMNR